jgi:hypothetical protein
MTKTILDLKAYVNSPFQLKFSGTVIGGSKGDISIDNITLTKNPSYYLNSREQNL